MVEEIDGSRVQVPVQTPTPYDYNSDDENGYFSTVLQMSSGTPVLYDTGMAPDQGSHNLYVITRYSRTACVYTS